MTIEFKLFDYFLLLFSLLFSVVFLCCCSLLLFCVVVPEVCKLHACVTGCEKQVLTFPRHIDTHIKCEFNKDMDF